MPTKTSLPRTPAEWADFATSATSAEMTRALNTCNNCDVFDLHVSRNKVGYCMECERAALKKAGVML